MLDSEEHFMWGLFIGAMAGAALALAVTLVPADDEWELGWCEGRGGTLVTAEVCNVDGRVVEVPTND